MTAVGCLCERDCKNGSVSSIDGASEHLLGSVARSGLSGWVPGVMGEGSCLFAKMMRQAEGDEGDIL